MYALQQIKHTHGIWDEWWYNGEKVNLLTICISLPALSHTYTHTHQPTAVPKTSYHTATSSLEAHTLGRWVRCTLSVAVRPQWSCSGATAPAPRLKSGGRRTGATVWGVFEEDRKVSSGFLSRLTCSSIGREHHGKQSSAASSPAPGRGHRVPVPRHLETFRQWW